MKRAFFISLIIHLSIFALFFYISKNESFYKEKNRVFKTTLNLKKITFKKEEKVESKRIIKKELHKKNKKQKPKKNKSKIKKKSLKKPKPKPKHIKHIRHKTVQKNRQKSPIKSHPKSTQKPPVKTDTKITQKPKNETKKIEKKEIKEPIKKAIKNSSSLDKNKKESNNDNKEFNIFLSKIREEIEEFKQYPRIARRLHKEGVVIVSFKLKASGKVEDLKVIKSAVSILDRAALRSIKRASVYFPKPKRDIKIRVPLVYRLK